MYELLWWDMDSNKQFLKSKIDEIRDKYNQLYKTKLIEYNPLHTVDITKTGSETDTDTKTTDSTDNNSYSDSTNTHAESLGTSGQTDTTRNSGYDSNVMTDTKQLATTANSGSSGTTTGSASGQRGDIFHETEGGTHTGNDHEHEVGFRSMGGVTYQSLIQAERDLVLSLEAEYVKEFANCFNLTM